MPTKANMSDAAYLGPLTGGVSNFLLLTLFTFSFGVTTGAHLNPASELLRTWESSS